MFPSANYNRRFRSKRQSVTRTPMRKLVSFQLGSERYAIAIDRVQRVLKEFTPHAILLSGRGLAEYNNETIPLIDLSTLFVSSQDSRERHYLIVCLLQQGERLGIPVPDMPTILEVAEDKFDDIPALYRQNEMPEAINRLIHTAKGEVVFYIDLEQLVNQLSSISKPR